MSDIYPVVIVGAGPAGIGVESFLSQCDIPPLILERERIGESFLRWPEETRFISPSFHGNFFGSVGLNAITPESSPAYGFQTEHPSGPQYARYLEDVSKVYDLDIAKGGAVEDFNIEEDDVIALTPNEGEIHCNILIWPAVNFNTLKQFFVLSTNTANALRLLSAKY